MKSNQPKKLGRVLFLLHLVAAGALALAACQPIVDTRVQESPVETAVEEEAVEEESAAEEAQVIEPVITDEQDAEPATSGEEASETVELIITTEEEAEASDEAAEDATEDAAEEMVEEDAVEETTAEEAQDEPTAELDEAEETAEATEAESAEAAEDAVEEGATDVAAEAQATDAGMDTETDTETDAAPAIEAEVLLEPAVATITTRSLRVREAPDPDSEVVAGARQGERYPVIAISADGMWVQIEIERSETGVGWVSAAFISLEGDITETATAPMATPAAAPTASPTTPSGIDGPSATVNTRSLIARAEPLDTADVVAGLTMGDRFNVLGISPDGVWLLLELADIEGGEGWVQATFVRLAGDLTAIPTIGELEVEEEAAVADEEAAGDLADAETTAPGDLPYSTATVNTRSLFVRELPTTDSDPVAGARLGESYPVIAVSDDGLWVQIRTPRSETGVGWVFAEFVILE